MIAWELIQDPKCWTQGEYARNEAQYAVCFDDAAAICWCALGAINKVYNEMPDSNRQVRRLEEHLDCAIATWNDTADHTTVLAKLKELDI